MESFIKVMDGSVGDPLAVAYLIYKSFPEMAILGETEKRRLFEAIVGYLKVKVGLTIWTESQILAHIDDTIVTERNREVKDICEKILERYKKEENKRYEAIKNAINEFREKFLLNATNESQSESLQEQIIRQIISEVIKNKGNLTQDTSY